MTRSHSPKKEISSLRPKKNPRRSPQNLKFCQSLAATHEKVFLGGRGVYIVENKDTNTDYQKVVRVGDQKREIVEITIGILFFCLRFVFTNLRQKPRGEGRMR